MFTETYGYHSSGPAGSPGMGQYVPTADLNASKKKKKLKEAPLKMKHDDAIDVVLAKSVKMKVSDVENKPGRHVVTLNQEFTMEEREDTTTEE